MTEADRLAAIERRAGELAGRVERAERDIERREPLATIVATMGVELNSLKEAFDELVARITRKAEQDERDRKALRNVLLGLTVTILIAIATAIATATSAGVHP